MDLIDRYLAAIARRLPADKAEDIIAEIRDDLLTRQEAREEALDRPLDKSEVAALVKDMGHPLIIASRYRPRQYLIGPDAFPFFVMALRIVAMFLVVVFAIDAASGVVFGHVDPIRAIARACTDILSSAMLGFGTVVAIFYALERGGFPADYLAKWRPQELPEVKDKQPSTWGSAFEVAIGGYFILWWCGLVPFPTYYGNVKGLVLTPDPVWASVWWPVCALMVARLIYTIVQWLRPRWKAVRAVLSVGTAAGGLALCGVIYRAGHWLTASGTITHGDIAAIDRSVNLAIHWAIVVVGAIWVWQCLQELWLLATSRPPMKPAA
ncbi:MAG: hypothetical protein ACTHJR_07565 [Sphingomonas sp.]|uniref:hypothetical protein n=1 Tax=Sphingomonas sp. TaxID=28214 RepID=UPI003F8002CB